MSSIKVDVAWSPVQDDRFLVCRNDLCLYKTEPVLDKHTTKGMAISDDTFASLVSTNSEHQYIKCVAWYPKAEPENLVAVGLATGRVVLTSFGRGSSSDPHRLLGKEMLPKHQRQCSYLAWNSVDSHLLAEGLEKYRTDYSVLIWDVHQRASYSDWTHVGKSSVGSQTEASTLLQRPFVELGSGETTLSLAWFTHEPQVLVSGMNNKFLRIYDLRDTSRPVVAAYTKAVYGVKIDPLCQHRLASFHEGQISIWDTRNLEKPLSTIAENKNIVKLAWSPLRSGLLACLPKESCVVKLYDIQHSFIAEEIEPNSAAERRIICPDEHIISSFDWHPTVENRMLMVSPAGTVKDIRIFERMSVCWSPEVGLSWVNGRQLWCADKPSDGVTDDISFVMKHRALKGYGVQKDIGANAQIISDDVSLRNVWTWIKYMKEITSLEVSSAPASLHTTIKPPSRAFCGIKSLVCDTPVQSTTVTSDMGASKSWLELWHWQGPDGHRMLGKRKVYHSHERNKALELCGWTYKKEATTSPMIEKLEKEKHYERAAAIAVFNLKLGKAIDILNKGAAYCKKHEELHGGDTNLWMVSMALSGFNDDKNSMWQETSSQLSHDLTDPYLRNMFRFLTCDLDKYDTIMNDSELEVSDRVAFACFYLHDTKLAEFIEKLVADLTVAGDLSAILLTGFTADCLELFQNYVDLTGDVQTAALALLQALPNQEVSRDARFGHWLDTYRELLDTWRLWHQRAELDVYHQSCEATTCGPPWVQPQVFVSCNFCGKSVSFNSLATRSRTFVFGGTAAHKPRVTSCPSCRKPLPRCALCLINMGTSAGAGKQPMKDTSDEPENQRLAKFHEWFTWCQTCRHGGHAEHMTQWFRDHTDCPVTGCVCKCATLDSMGSLLAEDTTKSGDG